MPRSLKSLVAPSPRALRAITGGIPLTSDVIEADRYGRSVTRCALPDGSDRVGTIVAQGQARYWPRFSAGIYNACEGAEAAPGKWSRFAANYVVNPCRFWWRATRRSG